MASGRSSAARHPRRSARVPVLLGLIALTVALIPASSMAAKVPKNFVSLVAPRPLDNADLQQIHKIKVKSVRVLLNWRATEPQKGVFHWPDAQVANLAKNGIAPTFTVLFSPQWATHTTLVGAPPLKGEAKRAWKGFLMRAVKRYKPGGKFWRQNPNLPKKPVRAWQIWNEPNLPKYFAQAGRPNVKQVKHTPKAYGKFVKTSDKAIHKADKHAKVILAGLSGNPKKKKMEPQRFLKTMLKVRKVEKHFDAAALHPYAPTIKDYKKRISKAHKALKKGGAKKKELWLTEIGWGSATDKFPLTKGPGGQARLLKKSFKVSLKKRKKWNIDRIFWYDWRDPPASAPVGCTFCNSAGLLKFDRTPKPAYKKFKRFAKRQGRGGHHHRHG